MRWLLGALLSLCISSTAFASEPYARYNWAGLYVGVNGGYGWGRNTGGGYSSFQDNGIGGLANFFGGGGNVLPNLSSDGFLGGAQVGYNWHASPMVVYGVVADVQAADISDSGANNVSIGNFANITQSKSVRTDWFGTVRGKLGFAANNFLIYGTGGLAYGRVEARTSFDNPSFGGGALVFAGSKSRVNAGWALGGGFEWGISPNWTVGAEYLHINLGDLTVTERRVSGPANASTFTSKSEFRHDILRLTVNYRF
jgi:outer membrane immunogenic protein